MLKHVTICTNNLEPETWAKHQVEDVLKLLVETFPGKLPDNARIYHHSVCQTNDVTPGAETVDKDIEYIQSLPGPFFIVVFPEAQALPYIIAIVLAVASYVFAPGAPKPPPLTLGRNQQTASPNNELSDRTNRARLNGRIPDIYGTVRSTPDLISTPYKVFENNREVEYAYMCIGRGGYVVSDIRDGDTQCSNIPGMSVQIYAPYTSPLTLDVPQITIGQSVAVPVLVAARSNSVNGQVLRPSNTSTFTGIGSVRFTTPNQIELFPNAVEDFTKYFVEGDELTITNATMTTGVAVTEVLDCWATMTEKYYLLGAKTPFNASLHFEPGSLVFESKDESSVSDLFVVGATITITQTEDFNETDFDLSGTYEVDLVEIIDLKLSPTPVIATIAKKQKVPAYVVVRLVSPESVASDWNLLYTGTNRNKMQKFRFEVGHDAGESYDLDLDGTYTIISVTKEIITLDNPVAVNADWAIVASHISTPYLSPTLASVGLKWVGPFILSDRYSMSAYCNFVAQNGLYKDDGVTQEAVAIQIEVECTPVDGLDEPIGDSELFSITMSGSATLKETLAITLKADFGAFFGRFSVRARRVTETDTEFEGTVVDEVRWRDIYSIAPVPDNANFGNVTTVAAVTFATASALAVKERKLNMLVQRKIPTYVDGHFTDILAGTNDTALILNAVCRDNYIGNRQENELDIANFFAIAAEVETYFGTARVREFNYTFDKEDLSFEETVDTIARAMFCIAYRRGNLIKLSFDKATLDSTLLFNHRNKIPGTEKRSVNFGGASVENDGIEYTYVDPRDDSINTIFLPPELAAINPKKVESNGIRDHLAAYFHAWRIWNRILYQNQTVEFDATQEADLLIINDRILVSDGTRANIQEGEVDAIDGTELTLSQLVDLTADPPYTIFLQHFDATVEAIEITAGTDANQVVLADAPVMDLVTAKDRYAKSTYLIVGSNDVTQKAFLVSEKSAPENMRSTVQAVNYHSGYYANDKDFINDIITEDGYGDTGGFTPGTGNGYVPPIIPPVLDGELTEPDVVTLTWTALTGATVYEYRVYRSAIGANSFSLVDTTSSLTTADVITAGEAYDYRVDAVIGHPLEIIYSSNIFQLCDIGNVSLLVSFNGPNGSTSFIDLSNNALVLTPHGLGASITTTSPKFGTGCFNGTGDTYIDTPLVPDGPLDLDADFTFEAWVRWDSLLFGASTIFQIGDSVSGYGGMYIGHSSGGQIQVTFIGTLSGAWSNLFINSAVTAGSYYHIAVVRQGNNGQLYVNGVGASIPATDWNTIPNWGAKVSIGNAYSGGGIGILGAVDDARITKGLARYTSNFTPPTFASPTSCLPANISLLTHFDGSNGYGYFPDESRYQNELVPTGVFIDTVDKKFGVGSATFDGSGDSLAILMAPQLELSDGDFTVEFWFSNGDLSSDGVLISCRNVGNTSGFEISVDRSTKDIVTTLFGGGATYTNNVPALAADVFYHLAVSLNGTTLRTFLEGVQIGTGTTSGTIAPFTQGWTIGSDVSSNTWLGNIDEVRITKGLGRYTTGFTPPSVAFPT